MALGGSNPLRQQMINMMYLVLLALMALNVSAEILKAFEIVGKSIEESIESIESKNSTTMAQFEAQLKNDRERTEPYLEKARQANAVTAELASYIDDIKQKMVKESGGRNPETGELNGAKNTDLPSRLMIDQKKGEELQAKINSTRQKFIDILENAGMGEAQLKEFKSQMTLQAEDPKNDRQNRDWSTFRFQSVPVAAAVTLLTKMENDVKVTQSNVLDRLLSQIGAEEMSFDQLTPVVKARKSSVAEGETFEAEILLAAYSSTKNPEIYVEGESLDVSAGKATYTATPSSSGTRNLEGRIVVKNPTTGEETPYPFEIEYDVFKAPAIISADAMTVLYKGLENPISVSVPGYKPEEVSASMRGGSLISKGGGKYIAKVSSGREATISVAVRTQEGKTKSVGSQKFRIKPVPKPTAFFGSKASGTISAGEVKVVNFIVTRMGDGFAFEGIKYTVEKYKFIYQPRRGNAQFLQGSGPRISGAMKQVMSNPQKGDMIIITDIYAKGPDGSKRLDNGITLTVE